MAFGFYFVELVEELLVGANYVGGALDARDLLAVHVLFFDDAEAVADGLVGVGQERVLQVVLFCELLLRFHGVARDAEDDDSRFLQLGEVVSEAAGFDGATGRVGLGIEEEDDGLAGEIREADLVAVLIGEGKVFDETTDLHEAELLNIRREQAGGPRRRPRPGWRPRWMPRADSTRSTRTGRACGVC